jgi:hypothetical protein
MKNTDHEMQDELRSEYDLTQLRIRKLAPQRSKFGSFVKLAPDVEKVFPNSEAVNEALRFLIRVAQQDQEHEHHK